MKRVAFAVVSPHRDDAALSLGAFLGTMARRRVPFRIINCFTISAWAPYRPGLTVGEVARLRRREDRCFGRRLAHAPQWCDLRGVDAPLRLGESFPILDCADDALRASDVAWLARALETAANAELVLAPLALGGHIDHLVARHAASAMRSRAIAFYEDIPYAGIVTEEERMRSLATAQSQLARTLHAVTSPCGFAEKHSLARVYRSQIGEEEVAAIRAAVRCLGGERLWADDAARARLTAWIGGAA